MKNFRQILTMPGVALMLTLLTLSCRGGVRWERDEMPDADSETIAIVDTLPADTVPARLTFNDSEEILAYMAASSGSSRYERGILPQMARTAPEYAEELLNNHHPRFVIADKGSMRVIVYDSCGVELKSFRMACGRNYGTKHKRRDCRTPEGLFSVEGVYNSTEWLYTDDDGNTSQVKGQYGPRFIRLRIPGTSQIGIHGTCAPWSVGGRRSHGCMRLNNDDIMELVAMVEKGMPVIVNPSLRDQKVNLREESPVRRVFTGYPDPDEVRRETSVTDDVGRVEVRTEEVGPVVVQDSLPEAPRDTDGGKEEHIPYEESGGNESTEAQ